MTLNAAFYTGNKSFSIESSEPVAVGDEDVQIDVAYCGICGTDLHVYLGHMDARVGDHRVIGHEMSGVVSSVGSKANHIKPGQKVVVRPLDHCGECAACQRGYQHVCQNLNFLGLDTPGAFQHHWTVPAHTVHVLPDSMPLDLAALIEPTAVACHDVKRGNIVKGEDALVIGGGPIGMLVAMVAQQAGANVTVSEINPHRLAMAESLGMSTIDPSNSDAAAVLMEQTNGKGMDIVFEVSGTQPGVDLMTAVTATRGRIVMVAIHAQKPEIDLFQFFWKEIEMLGARVYEPEDYDEAIRLIASEAIPAKSLITGVQALDSIQAAFEELTKNPTSMKTLIRCNPEAAA
ncbi:MAG: alcohol dehydrogenase catalytic domain-containing protein [Gammaproteobacteria bacterium]|nr:alcohol dehydrogenase catalytic domain-containing protein [Gammaproteobacteria bacterium]